MRKKECYLNIGKRTSARKLSGKLNMGKSPAEEIIKTENNACLKWEVDDMFFNFFAVCNKNISNRGSLGKAKVQEIAKTHNMIKFGACPENQRVSVLKSRL